MSKKIEVTIKKVTSDEPNVSKRHVSYDVYHNGKYHTTFKDVNDAMDHKEKMQKEEVELDEKVLDIQQRQKRAQIMRRYKSKIVRAREIAKKRMAPEANIRKRAFVQARQMIRRRVAGARGAEYEKLGPSEKMAIDRAVEGKQKAIKKLALRLIPRVKQAEAKRLHTFMKGQQLQSHGQPEGKSKESSGSSSVKESLNNLFSEAFAQPDPAADAPVATSQKKMPKKDKSKNTDIIQYNKFQEEVELDTPAFAALFKKSEKSGIDLETLGEVYNRGWNAWTEGLKVTQEQYAFARVNSFINQGKTYFNEDSDLHELSKDTMKRYKDDATWDRDYERGAEDDKTWQKRDKGIQLAKKKLSEMGGDQHYSDTRGATSGGAKGTPISKDKMKKDASKTLDNLFQKDMKKEDLDEGREPGTPSIKRYTRNDGTTALKSLNKWGKRKDWRDTEGGLAKAKEHAGVDKIAEEREVELHDGGPSRNIKKATLIGNHKTQKDHVIIRTHDYLGKPKDLVIHKDWIKEEAEMSLYDKIQAKRAEMRKNPEPEKEPPYKRKPALTTHDRDRRRLDKEDAQAQIRKRIRKEEVQQTNENWISSPIKWRESVRAKHGDVTFKRKSQPGVTGKSDTHATNSEGKVVGVYQHHNKMGRVYEEVSHTNENFIDGKGPGKPGDSARHGLKGKSAAELRNIRSSETASPRKKQLAHWLLNMHHNEAVEESLEDPKDNPCWKGYKPVGTKKLRGKTVPNCVPVTEGLDLLFFTEESWKTTEDAVKAAKKFIDDGTSKAVQIWTHNGKFYLNDVDYSKESKALKDFGAKLIKIVKEELRPDPKVKVEGTNCRNCVYWRKDLEKPVTKEELNPNGGLKAPNKEYIAMSKRIDLGTLPGKDSGVKVKGFCDHDMIKDWVTERMCCSQWDSDGMIRDYKGQSPVMKEEDTGNGTKLVDKESRNSKARKKIEIVDRKPPHGELTRQAELKNKIIDEKLGNVQKDPKKRLIGTDSLVKAYKADTPFSESLDEAFNIAYAAGVGVTLTAADLGMKAQGGFAYHPSVVEQMDEVEEEVRSADTKGVIVRTADGKAVVRKQKVNRKIIGSGNVHDGEPNA